VAAAVGAGQPTRVVVDACPKDATRRLDPGRDASAAVPALRDHDRGGGIDSWAAFSKGEGMQGITSDASTPVGRMPAFRPPGNGLRASEGSPRPITIRPGRGQETGPVVRTVPPASPRPVAGAKAPDIQDCRSAS
jgi:hypothetical protein